MDRPREQGISGLSEEEAGWDVCFRASLDGGTTWLSGVKVTEQSTRNDRAKKRRFVNGHTAGLAAELEAAVDLRGHRFIITAVIGPRTH